MLDDLSFIALSGDSYAGKDTAAEAIIKYLKSKYDIEASHEKLAFGIRDETAKVLNEFKSDFSHRELFDNRDFKEGKHATGYIPVELMKEIGEDARKISPTYWLDQVLFRIWRSKAKHVVVSDLRHIDDHTKLKELKGVKYQLLYIEAPNNPKVRQVHSSTAHLDTLKELANDVVVNHYNEDFSATLGKLMDIYYSCYWV